MKAIKNRLESYTVSVRKLEKEFDARMSSLDGKDASGLVRWFMGEEKKLRDSLTADVSRVIFSLA